MFPWCSCAKEGGRGEDSVISKELTGVCAFCSCFRLVHLGSFLITFLQTVFLESINVGTTYPFMLSQLT